MTQTTDNHLNNLLPQKPACLLDGNGPPVYEVGEVTSVLDVAWELQAQDRFPVLASVLGTSQTSGRGRGGQSWASPEGHLYAALRLPQGPPFEGSLASISLALVLSLALEERFGLKTALKWPNDLIYRKGKCGGLLLENRRGALIAGIGLNLTSPPPMPKIRNPLAPPAGALPGEIGPPRRLWLEVAQWVLMDYNKRLYARSENWSQTIIDQAERRLLGLGQMVTIHNPSTQPPASVPALSGKLTGLAPGGALTLEGPFGQVAVWSGTLTLNPGNFESP